MNINANYGQFYRGSESIVGRGAGAKKDTIVRYEFNTRDAHGNKIMDKMSKEETMKAMKDIRSQYGDNVIVEFSGDGLAKLAHSKKGMAIPESEEQKAARAKRDADFRGQIIHKEHIPVDADKLHKMSGAPDDYVDMESWLRDNDPELGRQIDELNDSIMQGPSSGNHGAKFLELMTKAAKEIIGDEPKLSDKAQKVLDELSDKYKNMDFFAGSPNKVKGLMAKSSKEFSVLFSASELEKMANDESYKKEIMEQIDKLGNFAEKINKEFGFNASEDNENNTIASKFGLVLDSNGKISLFAELTNKAENKVAVLQGQSEDDLTNLIKNLDWSKVNDK